MDLNLCTCVCLRLQDAFVSERPLESAGIVRLNDVTMRSLKMFKVDRDGFINCGRRAVFSRKGG